MFLYVFVCFYMFLYFLIIFLLPILNNFKTFLNIFQGERKHHWPMVWGACKTGPLPNSYRIDLAVRKMSGRPRRVM